MKDPMQQLVEIQQLMLSTMASLSQVMGGTLPESVQKYIESLNQIPTGVNTTVTTSYAPGSGASAPGSGSSSDYAYTQGYTASYGASPNPIPAARGFGPVIAPNLGGGLGPLIQTHAGEGVLVVPRKRMTAGGFIGAASGYGLVNANGTYAGGSTNQNGPSRPTINMNGSASSGYDSSGINPSAGGLGKKLDDLASAVADLAKVQPVQLQFNPQSNVTVPTQGGSDPVEVAAAFTRAMQDRVNPEMLNVLGRFMDARTQKQQRGR
jgi:hypothetical protein